MPPQVEDLRAELVFQCYAVRPGTRDVPHMLRMARRDGDMTDLSEASIRAELAYLVDKGYLKAVPDPFTKDPDKMRYRITAEGIDFLEGTGLI